MCGSPAKAGQAIIPLKSKLYYNEKKKLYIKEFSNGSPYTGFLCFFWFR